MTQMREYLLSLNVRSEKIIAPTIFLHRNAEKYQLDLIHDVCLNCHGIQGLIFGLSYSQRDICIRSLEIPFYDCSWSSLDLYYNYRIFQYMEEHKMLTGLGWHSLFFPITILITICPYLCDSMRMDVYSLPGDWMIGIIMSKCQAEKITWLTIECLEKRYQRSII